MIEKQRVFVEKVVPEDAKSLASRMREALDYLRIDRHVSRSSRVFIKPNFTYPFHKHGVTTSPGAIEALVACLRDTTERITIVESDGGAHAWRADEAFAGHGIPELCRKYGITCRNLTDLPREIAAAEIDGREVRIELASPMLHESDLFITMPVPKMHVMTGMSLAFKNQWGCIPDVKRLRNHPDLPHKVLAVNKLLRTKIAVFDGSWFLDRTGPMDGDPIAMNLLIASDDPGAGSLVCCKIMGLDPASVRHKKLAMKIGMMPASLDLIDLNREIASLATHQFTLQRSPINYLTLAAFNSRLATWLVYDSSLARPIHELLYLIRGRPKDMAPYW